MKTTQQQEEQFNKQINKTSTNTMQEYSGIEKTGDTQPVLKGGSCYSFTTTNTQKWYDVFAIYYFDNVSEDSQNELIDWKEKTNKKAVIKYEKKDQNLSLTITIHKTTGTIMAQGSARSLNIWIEEHYPKLQNLLQSQEVGEEGNLEMMGMDKAIRITTESTNNNTVALNKCAANQPRMKSLPLLINKQFGGGTECYS